MLAARAAPRESRGNAGTTTTCRFRIKRPAPSGSVTDSVRPPCALSISILIPGAAGCSFRRTEAGDALTTVCGERYKKARPSPSRAASCRRRRDRSLVRSLHNNTAPAIPSRSVCSAAHRASLSLAASIQIKRLSDKPACSRAGGYGTCGGRALSDVARFGGETLQHRQQQPQFAHAFDHRQDLDQRI